MDETATTEQVDSLQLAAGIVAAFVSNNPLRAADLPDLIVGVHAALAGLSSTTATPGDPVERPTSSRIRKSITPDALISFIDGKPYKTLKRHLSTHGLDVETYRTRYGLPADYPAVAARYSEARSLLAKGAGFGKQRRKSVRAAAE